MISIRHKVLLVTLLSVIATVAAFAAVMIYNLRAAREADEAERLRRSVLAYNELMWLRQRGSEALLQAVAWRPDVRRAMRERDRDRLMELLGPTFGELQKSLDVSELSVYAADDSLIVRIHEPANTDPSITNPAAISEAHSTRRTISGISLVDGRMSHRTVAPVLDGRAYVGSLEAGISYDESVLRDFRARRDADSRIWLTRAAADSGGISLGATQQKIGAPGLLLYVSTFGDRRLMPSSDYLEVLKTRAPAFALVSDDAGQFASIAVPIMGLHDQLLGVLEMSRSRAEAAVMFEHSLLQTVGTASLVALGGMVLIGATLNWVVLRPLKKLTLAARRQYEGHLAARVEHASSDEFGLLADTFNSLSNRLTQTLQEQTQTIDKLRQAQRSAEQANAAKDEFLAALSHELRTPLTPVLLAAENLDKNPSLPAELRDDVMGMRRNVLLEARLIDDLLDLTRIARGKLELHLETCEVHTLIASALDVCRADIETKRLAVTTELVAQRQWIRADSARMQQVFWNLLKNAMKFTPSEGKIAISTRNAAIDGRDFIELVVADSGIGMSASTIARIFHLFEQGSRSITRRFGGLGLGLVISRSIVDLHGGTISADSAGPGEGSTFTVTLPTIPAPQAVPKPKARVDSSIGALRILLVEDHAPTAHAMKRLLEGFGHQVHLSGTIAEALNAAVTNGFDLVISDLGLPDGSGTDLMAILHDKHGLTGIAVSGYGMQDDIARSTGSGFAAHLTKPITSEQVRTAILEVMGQHAASLRESQ